QRHGQQCAAADVRVRVESGIHAGGLQRVQLREHDVGVGVEVRDVHLEGRAGFAFGATGDLGGFGDAFRGVGLVAAAHVRDVHASGAGDRRTQGGDLVRVLEDAGDVVQPA